MRYIRTITPTDMRAINRSAVLDLIRRESPISRTTIAEKLDVSLPTVMRIMDELIEEGLVRPLGITEWSGGRRRSLLEFNARGQVMIGIDLGGFQVYGTAADLAGNVLFEMSLPFHPGSAEDNYHQLVELIARLLKQTSETGITVRGIGVGAPGVTDYEQGVVENAPSLHWQHFPLRQRLAERFRLPAIVDNDVNLSALGEVWFGTEQNANCLVLITVGTGIGAGIVIDGAIYRGSHLAAGEVGYLLPGREYLGQVYSGLGAIESLAAIDGIIGRSRQALAGQRAEEELKRLQAGEVFDAFLHGEAWAECVINETADYLAMVVISLGLCLDPDVIVLGGDLSQRFGALVGPVLARVRGTLNPGIKLVASNLGRRAVVLGAVINVLHQSADFYSQRSI